MPQAAPRSRAGPIGLAAFVILSIALLVAFAPAWRGGAAERRLDISRPLPDHVPPAVVLRIGDPVTEWVFQHLGWEKRLPFTIQWAQITGGPDVTEAFHA